MRLSWSLSQSLATLTLLFSLSNFCFALIEVGDAVPNHCWKDSSEKDVCLEQFAGTVRVLIYNTGWCPDCTEHFTQLIPRLNEVASSKVNFLSLSAAGWTKGSLPDVVFLNDLKKTFQIPFPVLASPKDAGKEFFEQPYIPNTVIINQQGQLALKSYELSIDEIFQKIKELVQH